ncbi:MAG: acetate--CoA ligase family protein [Desulfarculus sp.]|nr:acetate--CoA ligase family protein [Desulfarculus sp.]
MRGFFHPQSVAVVGVSPRAGNLGRNIVANLETFGFTGPVYYVSPRGGEYKGQTIHQDVRELDQVPDLAVILTPAATVPEILESCGQKGIKRVVIESGGFSELDQGHGQLEAQIKDTAQRHGLRFIGPNCIGVICAQSGLAVPFPMLGQAVPKGGLSLICQSGGIGLTYLHRAAMEGLGIAKFASVGNKANVNEEDLLAYYLEDPDTQMVLLYLESIVDGRRMCELIRASDKPVVVHKSNIAHLSHGIAQSHTAALANDDLVVEEALAQCGALRAHTVNDCLTILKGLSMPRPKGRRLAVISRSGGHAVVAADAAFREGMELPPLPQSYLEPIQEAFRASVIKLQNPLDLGDLFHFELYVEILRGALAQDNVDGVVVVHGYRGPEVKPSRQFISQAGDLARQYDKPVALVLLTTAEEMDQARQISSLPIFDAPEEAIKALSMAQKAGGKKAKQGLGCAGAFDTARAERILATAGPDGGLELPEALHLITAAGLAAAQALGFPVSLKAVGASLSHKSDQGGVVLNLGDAGAVEQAAAKMMKELKPNRLVVMSMISGGQEVIVGAKRDPSFGPVVLVGLGGVTAEVLKDVRLGLAPLADGEAGAMLDGLKGAALLKGFRGRPPASRPALVAAVMQVSNLISRLPQLWELDINPLLVGPGGAMAVDARVSARPPKPRGH